MVRTKQRYVLCEIVTNATRHRLNLKASHINHAVRLAVQEAHGDYGMGCLMRGLSVTYVNNLTGLVMIRAHRDVHRVLMTTLPFIKKIGSEEAFLRTLHIGGTIRCCQKFVTTYHRQQLQFMLARTANPDERNKIQETLLSTSIDLDGAVSCNIVATTKQRDKDLF